jgi:hypothetical protein
MRTGKTKTQKTAPGSRKKASRRILVSSRIGGPIFVTGFVPDPPPGEEDGG